MQNINSNIASLDDDITDPFSIDTEKYPNMLSTSTERSSGGDNTSIKNISHSKSTLYEMKCESLSRKVFSLAQEAKEYRPVPQSAVRSPICVVEQNSNAGVGVKRTYLGSVSSPHKENRLSGEGMVLDRDVQKVTYLLQAECLVDL